MTGLELLAGYGTEVCTRDKEVESPNGEPVEGDAPPLAEVPVGLIPDVELVKGNGGMLRGVDGPVPEVGVLKNPEP